MQPIDGVTHSSDGRWWWDGVRWLPAVSIDGRWWWDGARWLPTDSPYSWVVPPSPGLAGWRRWACTAGGVLLVAAGLGFFIGGLSVMGDPAPGQQAALEAAKSHNMSVTLMIVLPLAVAGALLLAVARLWPPTASR